MNTALCVVALAVGAGPERIVLDGVPRVGVYPKQSTSSPEDHAFPSCLRAILEYLDDPIYEAWPHEPGDDWHTVHVMLMGTSGTGFAAVWPRGGWNAGGNWQITGIAPEPLEPLRLAFESVGYEPEILLRGSLAGDLALTEPVSDDEVEYRRRIAASLEAGRPVVALGLMGEPQAGLICGLDEGGEVLVGWSWVQDERALDFEPQGYFRQRDWFDGLGGIVVFGEAVERPPLELVCGDALAWALRLMRTPEVRGTPAGDAAFATWADDLADDDAVAALTGAELEAARRASDDMGGHLAEARAWAGVFLNGVEQLTPELHDELHAADDAFMLIHDLVWRLWQTQRGDEAERAMAFVEPELRTELRRLALLMRAEDAAAAAALEAALRELAVAPEDILPAPAGATAALAGRTARLESLGADPARVIRRGTDGTWLADQPPLDWGEGRERFDPAALADLARRLGREVRCVELPASADSVAYQAAITDLVLSINTGLPALIRCGDGWATVVGYHIWSANLLLVDLDHPNDAPRRLPSDDPSLLGGQVVFMAGR